MAIFPVLRGKNRISQGVEDWGSPISAPWALRAIVFTVRSGPVWRQDFAILSPEGPCDNTCKLRLSEENKEHPKTQRAPENAGNRLFPEICVFGCVAFSGALCSPLRGRQDTPENATHPKTQSLGTVDYLRFRVCCVFGCSLLAPAKKNQGRKKPINHLNLWIT